MAHQALKGSERYPMPGAILAGKADPNEHLDVTILLRRRNAAALTAQIATMTGHTRPGGHLSREAFAARFGADAADIARIHAFAKTNGLTVTAEDAGRRTMVLSGTVAQCNAAFAVDLQRFEHQGGAYRGRTGPVNLPEELQGAVEAVLGLDDRPVAKPHFRAARAANASSYTPLQIASLYNFPHGTGSGTCVAIIELGGGEKKADLTTYFSGLGISPAPKITTVSVDHGKNKPVGTANSADGEVMLDIEIIGAVAPQTHIVVYFAPNTDAGFLDAITTAAHDTTNKPSVISISWGGPESSWTAQSLTAFDSAFQAAAALGITVCVASGDNGSTDGVTTGGDHVDFPASSPHALACGGTTLHATGTTITSESAWNDGAQGGAGGGGVSTSFPTPSYQTGLKAALTAGGTTALTTRGVPDVSGNADPATGYDVRVDGTNTVFGGTSAVAPLWAGLIARINGTHSTTLGFINPLLYANQAAFNDVTTGNNGTYAAAKGWDACTGLGSPNGSALISVLVPSV